MADLSKLNEGFRNDIGKIERIPIVQTLLDVVCQTTGMGFAAIARVTEDKWITCSARDDIGFGLKPGDELQVKTTICNEIRQSHKAVIIDNVADNPDFCKHHTPAMYGFQSYISVPIIRKNNDFFGTLCAIDPKPNPVSSPAVTGMFALFADLIAFHLESIEKMESNETQLSAERRAHQEYQEHSKVFTDQLEREVEQRTRQLHEKNEALEKMNIELQSFTYVASHDLQEPLRKIHLFTDEIVKSEVQNLSARGKDYFSRIQISAKRMLQLIDDLVHYSWTTMDQSGFELTDLGEILKKVQADLADNLQQKQATIGIGEMCRIRVLPFQFRQLFYNLIGNSIKFANPNVPLRIEISSNIIEDKNESNAHLPNADRYCHVRVADNGIGFEPKYNERIFDLFKRGHNGAKTDGTGIGLAIVKKIVANHHGSITASGKVNEGVTFDIYIPVKWSEKPLDGW